MYECLILCNLTADAKLETIHEQNSQLRKTLQLLNTVNAASFYADHLPLAEEPVWFVSGFSFQGREVVYMSLRALAVDMYRCSVSQTVQSKGPVKPAAAKICSFGEL